MTGEIAPCVQLTGRLRFVAGRLQQEWDTSVLIPPVYSAADMERQVFSTGDWSHKYEWIDVPEVVTVFGSSLKDGAPEVLP